MTAQERLSLLDALWDSLAATPEAIPLTVAQCAELDRRLDDLDIEGPVGIPWDEVLSRIRSRRRCSGSSSGRRLPPTSRMPISGTSRSSRAWVNSSSQH